MIYESKFIFIVFIKMITVGVFRGMHNNNDVRMLLFGKNIILFYQLKQEMNIVLR